MKYTQRGSDKWIYEIKELGGTYGRSVVNKVLFCVDRRTQKGNKTMKLLFTGRKGTSTCWRSSLVYQQLGKTTESVHWTWVAASKERNYSILEDRRKSLTKSTFWEFSFNPLRGYLRRSVGGGDHLEWLSWSYLCAILCYLNKNNKWNQRNISLGIWSL